MNKHYLKAAAKTKKKKKLYIVKTLVLKIISLAAKTKEKNIPI